MFIYFQNGFLTILQKYMWLDSIEQLFDVALPIIEKSIWLDSNKQIFDVSFLKDEFTSLIPDWEQNDAEPLLQTMRTADSIFTKNKNNFGAYQVL